MKKTSKIIFLIVFAVIVFGVVGFSIYEGIANNRGPISALKTYFATEKNPSNEPIENEQPTHECIFSEWMLTVAPTCTEEGEETSTCSCGKTQTRSVAKISHEFIVKIIGQEPTLTENGFYESMCINCVESEITETIPATLIGRVFVAFEDEEGMAVYAFVSDNADGVRMYCGYAEIVQGHILVLTNANDGEDYFMSCSSKGEKIYLNNNLDSYMWVDEEAGVLRFYNEDVTMPILTGFDTISFG